ncbi:MAG: hypothetical protein BA865_09040 [Desulfobacterales bacterium S5133MH4]|jgi:tetratricopeptide (TPR) repeat protein|nr:MAG: hypothetical protein BA865_09040 [Desulfobacterales bacterium S5133MH4]
MDQPWIGANILKDAFPRMPVGEQFQELFESSAASSASFAVLVIRIDDLDRTQKRFGEDIASSVVLKLARIIDEASNTHRGKWGRLDHDLLACFCPDMDEAAADELARELQERLAHPGEETVSIGIAVHPFWPFEKMTALSNAKKALDHAAFFGPKAVTPFDAVSLNISADKLYQYGDIDGAIEEFKKAVAVDPQNVNVHNSLGVCYGVQGKMELAIDAFEIAIGLDPEDVMATYNLGLAHLKRGDKEKALGLFLEAHGIEGENPEVACEIGMCYLETGQTDTALEYLEKAAQKMPKGARVFRVLGDCYMKKGLLPDAVKAYEKAIKRHPTDANSLSALGHLYGALGENLKIAVVLCQESTAIDPENGLYRLRLGKLYLKNRENEKAVEQFKLAAQVGEDCSELLHEAESAMGAPTVGTE